MSEERTGFFFSWRGSDGAMADGDGDNGHRPGLCQVRKGKGEAVRRAGLAGSELMFRRRLNR